MNKTPNSSKLIPKLLHTVTPNYNELNNRKQYSNKKIDTSNLITKRINYQKWIIVYKLCEIANVANLLMFIKFLPLEHTKINYIELFEMI